MEQNDVYNFYEKKFARAPFIQLNFRNVCVCVTNKTLYARGLSIFKYLLCERRNRMKKTVYNLFIFYKFELVY